MNAVPAEAYAAIASVVVALTGVWIAYIQFGRRKKAEFNTQVAQNEMLFQATALSFDEFLSEWNEIHKEILALFEETSIDRFLLLRAWNGLAAPRWTTAFFQVREHDQKPFNYVHFELDNDYVSRVNSIVSNGAMSFKVADIPQSAIREIYEAEGVKHSAWFFIDKKTLINSASTAITYCSFATHEDAEITQEQMVRMRLIASRMKGVAHTMNSSESKP